jgi:hypothetical protein
MPATTMAVAAMRCQVPLGIEMLIVQVPGIVVRATGVRAATSLGRTQPLRKSTRVCRLGGYCRPQLTSSRRLTARQKQGRGTEQGSRLVNRLTSSLTPRRPFDRTLVTQADYYSHKSSPRSTRYALVPERIDRFVIAFFFSFCRNSMTIPSLCKLPPLCADDIYRVGWANWEEFD